MSSEVLCFPWSESVPNCICVEARLGSWSCPQGPLLCLTVFFSVILSLKGTCWNLWVCSEAQRCGFTTSPLPLLLDYLLTWCSDPCLGNQSALSLELAQIVSCPRCFSVYIKKINNVQVTSCWAISNVRCKKKTATRVTFYPRVFLKDLKATHPVTMSGHSRNLGKSYWL